MTDPVPSSEHESAGGGRGPTGPPELSVDLGAFLPEGVTLADAPGAEEPAGAHEEATGHAVDLGVLERLEADLAAVDAAIEAIDADDHARSPLLQALVDPPATGDRQGI